MIIMCFYHEIINNCKIKFPDQVEDMSTRTAQLVAIERHIIHYVAIESMIKNLNNTSI